MIFKKVIPALLLLLLGLGFADESAPRERPITGFPHLSLSPWTRTRFSSPCSAPISRTRAST